MSSHGTTQVTCPACNVAGPYLVWRSLNRDLDPDAALRLGRGEHYRYTCAGCQTTTNVVYPMLLHAMRQREMVSFAPGDEELSVAAFQSLGGVAPPTLWRVRSHLELVECERLFEADLDLLEMLVFRTLVRAQLQRSGTAVEALFFDAMDPEGPDASVRFTAFVEGEEAPKTVAVPRAAWERHRPHMQGRRASALRELRWYPYDHTTALRALPPVSQG